MAKFKVGDKIQDKMGSGKIYEVVGSMEPMNLYSVKELASGNANVFLMDAVDAMFSLVTELGNESEETPKHKCHCSLQSLLAGGCKCGGQ